jgi:DNA-binding NarL/FixJ family response regulator
MECIEIALLDDNPLYAMAFATVIDAYGECRVVSRSQSLPELMEALAEYPPDLIVADADLLDRSLHEGVGGLFDRYGQIPVLLMGFEPPLHLDAMRAAHPNLRFLSKDRTLDVILNTLVYHSSTSNARNRGAGPTD